MAKILIDVKESGSPKNDDIIAYNGSTKQWEVINKTQYLKSFRTEIKEMKANNEKVLKEFEEFTKEVNEEIKKMKLQLKEMAKIIKEGISNE